MGYLFQYARIAFQQMAEENLPEIDESGPESL